MQILSIQLILIFLLSVCYNNNILSCLKSENIIIQRNLKHRTSNITLNKLIIAHMDACK